jgi:sugar O-acyltransferase (sialic acid O-acetyltransferase NeuD family)
MEPIFLVGCGGLAREVFGWLKSERSSLLKQFKGFLVTDKRVEESELYGFKVYSLEEVIANHSTFNYIPTIGSNENRKRLSVLFNSVGGSPVNYISDNVPIGMNVTIGKGVIVNPRCSISSDVAIGDYVLINCNTGIGHDVVIEDFVSILGSCSINGNVTLGKDSLIGSGVCIHPSKSIGEGATVGMGAVVFRNVKENTTVIGNPAKKIG